MKEFEGASVRLNLFSLLLFLAICLGCGCNRNPLLRSKVPEVFTTNSLLLMSVPSVVAIQEIANHSAGTPYSYEVGREFSFQLASSDQNEVLRSLRDGIAQAIQSCGAHVHGAPESVSKSFQQFGYYYGWLKNDGLIKVYYTSPGSNRLDVLVFCYEYRK